MGRRARLASVAAGWGELVPCPASSGTLAQHRFALLSLILDYVVAIDPRSPEGSLTATSRPLPAMATRLTRGPSSPSRSPRPAAAFPSEGDHGVFDWMLQRHPSIWCKTLVGGNSLQLDFTNHLLSYTKMWAWMYYLISDALNLRKNLPLTYYFSLTPDVPSVCYTVTSMNSSFPLHSVDAAFPFCDPLDLFQYFGLWPTISLPVFWFGYYRQCLRNHNTDVLILFSNKRSGIMAYSKWAKPEGRSFNTNFRWYPNCA